MTRPDSPEIPTETREALRRELVAWFDAGHRDLPWRRSRDPYAIWISEIMLQQTRVETVTPYFERWMARFPTVRALAQAPLDDVLAGWAGLGYYARARNLHRAAQVIVRDHGGRFPEDEEAVRALPGVGPYTAGAILSIAFGRPAPILDGNVIRVLSRVLALDGAADDPALRKRLWAVAAALVPDGAASSFNQGLMELGATVCTPRAPACGRCPLVTECAAHEAGAEERYPAPKQKRAVPRVRNVTVLVERGGRLLLTRRAPSGLWGGLWEPPTGEIARGEAPGDAALRVAREVTGLSLDGLTPLPRFEHVLTHRRMQFQPYRAQARGRVRVGNGCYDDARWLAPGAAQQLGVAAWTARLLEVVRGSIS